MVVVVAVVVVVVVVQRPLNSIYSGKLEPQGPLSCWKPLRTPSLPPGSAIRKFGQPVDMASNPKGRAEFRRFGVGITTAFHEPSSGLGAAPYEGRHVSSRHLGPVTRE